MKVHSRKSNDERNILIAMIVDDIVLGRIHSKWSGNMFKAKWSNLIAKWSLNYYKEYQKAPQQQIEHLFAAWASKSKSKETVALVEKFLSTLSDEYEDLKESINSQFIIDTAGKYFNQVQIERLVDELQGDLDFKEIQQADDRIVSYHQIEMGVGEGIDILHDKEAIKEAFADERKSIVQYPGALGKFFGRSLERDGFIAFMGPEKRGKSFWLMDIAYRAMCQRKRVAFFEAGDNSKNQIMRRLMIRVSQHPMRPGKIELPTDIYMDDKEGVQVNVKTKKFKKGLDWRIARKACKMLMRKKIKSKHSYFKLSSHFNSTLSVRGMEAILQNWERENWTPDVVVVDYADILDMDHAGLEGRERINETWKQLRSLSQKYHCLLVAATQADAASYDSNIMRKKHFSEDKRKLSHVTGVVGINQSKEEKEMGVMRLNWVVLREDAFSESKCCHVAGCLAIGNPAMKSFF